MKRVIIIAVALIACFNLYSQNQTDSIQVVKKLGTVFQQNGKTLNIAQIESITSVNPQAVYSGQTDPSFRLIDPPPPEANPVRAIVSGYQ